MGNKLAKAVQAKNGCYHVQKAGLNAEAHMTGQTTRPVEPMFNPIMNTGDQGVDMEQETVHYHVALTEGQCTVGNKTIWMFGSFGLCIEYIF